MNKVLTGANRGNGGPCHNGCPKGSYSGFVLFCLCFLLFALRAPAANVTFKFVVANGIVDTNIVFSITPVFAPGTVQTNSIGIVDSATVTAATTDTNSIWDSYNRYIGSNGVFTVSNLTAATYLVTQNTTRFYIFQTNTDTGTYFASNMLTGVNITGANAVYTRAQSDGRYVNRTNGFGVSDVLTNPTVEGGLNYANLSTNVQTLSLPATLNFGNVGGLTNKLLTVSVSAAALYPGLTASNSWEATIYAPSNVMYFGTNCTFSAWVSATNTVTVAANNGYTNTDQLPSGIFRLVLHQWQ